VAGPGAGGNGALVNTAAPQLGALANVTLAGNTTFGGSGPWNTDPVLNRGRWDIRNGTLSSGGQAFNLTKVGSNQVTLAGTMVDAALADIDVQQGALGFEGATSSMGDSARTLTVRAGATVIFFDTTTAWNKKFVLFGNGMTPTLFNWNGENTVAGPVTLNGNVVIGGAPADRGTPISLTLSGLVDGTGGLTKIAADRLILGGGYSYTGDTTVNAGTLALTDTGAFAGSSNITVHAGATLDLSGAFGGGLTLVNGQTLKGNGTVTGTLSAPAGSIVSPGLGIGELTVSGDVALQGTTVIELDATRDTNDVLRNDGAITFAGTLQLTNIAGALAAGDAFKIFNATNYTGSFANIVPANPGSGLAWDTSTLASDGTLRIRASSQRPVIATTSVTGGAFIFSGTGGTPSATYYVLSSTNLAAAPSAWSRIRTNAFGSTGSFSVTNNIDPNTPQRFFLLELP
jgi:autotransporter-associated beta strand protein